MGLGRSPCGHNPRWHAGAHVRDIPNAERAQTIQFWWCARDPFVNLHDRTPKRVGRRSRHDAPRAP
jgi:hypothetical protein